MADINIDSLEPNSHKYKAEKDRKSNEPIIKRDQIVSTRKPMSKKITEMFVTGDAKDIKTWLLKDVLIPGIQNTILDILSMMFFDETDRKRSGSYRKDRSDRISYSRYYQKSSDRSSRESSRRKAERYDSDDRVDFRNIVLRERSDAEHLIEELRRRILDEGSVSVAELLDLIDVPGRYTDNNYGWDDERDIGIRRISSGYLIDVAEPKYLG